VPPLVPACPVVHALPGFHRGTPSITSARRLKLRLPREPCCDILGARASAPFSASEIPYLPAAACARPLARTFIARRRDHTNTTCLPAGPSPHPAPALMPRRSPPLRAAPSADPALRVTLPDFIPDSCAIGFPCSAGRSCCPSPWYSLIV
jgi:hypothetical protein